MKVLKVTIVVLAFLLGITAIILGLLYHHRDIEKKTMNDAARKGTTGSYIKLSAGITHYQLTGPDSGKVIILVNGFSVPYYIWDGTNEFLAKKGYRVLRYDAYGRGYSDRPDITYNRDLYLQQIYDLVTKLHLHTPFDIAGLSFGGEVTTDFTCRYPNLVNKVVLVDAAFVANPSAPRLVMSYEKATHPNEQALNQVIDFKYPQRHPEWYDRYWGQMEYKGFRNALVATMFDYKNTEKQSLKCLDEQNKPVLLIWGDSDQTVPLSNADTIRKILRTEFYQITDAAHLPQLDQPQKFNAKLIEFLKRNKK